MNIFDRETFLTVRACSEGTCIYFVVVVLVLVVNWDTLLKIGIYLMDSIWNLKDSIWNLKDSIWNLKDSIWNLKDLIWNAVYFNRNLIETVFLESIGNLGDPLQI